MLREAEILSYRYEQEKLINENKILKDLINKLKEENEKLRTIVTAKLPREIEVNSLELLECGFCGEINTYREEILDFVTEMGHATNQIIRPLEQILQDTDYYITRSELDLKKIK